MNILLYHAVILLNKNLTPASLESPCMHVHLDTNSGQQEELGVRAHNSWLHSPPIFVHILLILYVSWLWRCFNSFLHGRGLSSYINLPRLSLLFTPSSKASSLPPQSILSSRWPAMLSPCTKVPAPPTTLMAFRRPLVFYPRACS